MAVGFAKRASHTVMVNQGSLEALVCSDNLGWAAASPKQVEEEVEGDLIKTVEYVCSSSS